MGIWFSVAVYSPERECFVAVFDNVTERKRADEVNAERARLAELSSAIGVALASAPSLRDALQRCTEAIVEHLDAAFARIWTLDSEQSVLQLQASAGMYTRIDGTHARVRVGDKKIGSIAAERKPHFTNSVVGDPRFSEQEWARREGMVAFAGFPLLVGSDLVGVVAVFARHPLDERILQVLRSIADVVAVGIRRGQAELDLRVSAAHLSSIYSTVADVIFELAVEGGSTYRFVSVNPAFVRATGIGQEQVVGKTVQEVIPEPSLSLALSKYEEAIRLRTTVQWEETSQYPSGQRVGEVSVAPVFDDRGECTHLIGSVHDLTGRKGAEDALRESAIRFRQLAENIKEVFFVMDVQYRETLYISPAYEDVWGVSCQSLYDRPSSFLDPLPEEDRTRLAEYISRIQQGESPGPIEFRIIHSDGQVRWVRADAVAVRDSRGEVYRIAGTALDITESHKLEEQFRQAQKMEAVGRLAGGVAHDFNNVLTVISGYADMAGESLKPDDPLRQDIDEIREAAGRAAALTRQLLAFSRQQVLNPRVLDPNDLVAGIEKMLRRLVGEDVDVVASLTAGIGRIRADAGQIEQVLVNLAVNARDAMPDGGKLTIESSAVTISDDQTREGGTVPAGEYVLIAVTDNGTGMDAATKARIFEPFFTTKSVGKGTGLGLSTVFGVVRQSDGFIWVYSEPGHGTTFKIYLPRIESPVEAAQPAPRYGAQLDGTETVLVVEDEDAVRSLARATLTRRGYRVVTAANGGEALLVCEQHKDRIDLMVTDVIMPGLNGRDLARRLAPLRPDMRVLFVSGYADQAVVRHGELEPGIAYLEKPFAPLALAQKVRDVLDAT